MLSFSKYILLDKDGCVLSCTNEIVWPCVTNDSFVEESSLTVFNSFVKGGFLWIMVNYGNGKPWTEEVVNLENLRTEKNPRTPSQVEAKGQFFFALNLSDFYCYISNNKRKQLVEDFLFRHLKKKFVVTPILKSPEEFFAEINKIDSIELVSVSNLFQSGEDFFDMFSMSKDPFLLGKPREFRARLEFGGVSFAKEAIERLRSLFSKPSITQLICIGRGQDDIQKVLNLDIFSVKFELKITKKDNGMYDFNGVVDSFLSNFG